MFPVMERRALHMIRVSIPSRVADRCGLQAWNRSCRRARRVVRIAGGGSRGDWVWLRRSPAPRVGRGGVNSCRARARAAQAPPAGAPGVWRMTGQALPAAPGICSSSTGGDLHLASDAVSNAKRSGRSIHSDTEARM